MRSRKSALVSWKRGLWRKMATCVPAKETVATCAEDIIAEVEANIEALKRRLPSLEGKAQKKERAKVNKDIYNLENDVSYVAAINERLAQKRKEDAIAEDAAHDAKLEAEKQAVGAWARAGCAETETERTLRIYWRNQVEGLFDEYAPTFEKSLVIDLGYDVPQKLEALLARDYANEDGSVSSHLAVDLGCGTGLAAAQLRGRCLGRLIGCDLSGRMIREARKKRGVFDELEACDCVAFLQRRVEASSADLIIAADVLLYFRDLTDLFTSVARALQPGGLFVFSTELALNDGIPPEGRGWVERSSERIAHSEEYLRIVIEATESLVLRSIEVTNIRNEARKPIQGHLCVVSKNVRVLV